MTWADVLTHSIAFLIGAVTGAAGQYLADRFTDQRRSQVARSEADKRFEKVQRAMPAFIAEIKEDLAGDAFVREFAVLPTKTIPYSSSHTVFLYYEDQHPDLLGKVVLLESVGFVDDHSRGNNPLFRMSEEFVEQVRRS